MLIHSIKLNNFLSFSNKAEALNLSNLNVIIGPNGSGKSNLLESLELLRNAPDQLLIPIREGGGVQDWLWKGARTTPTATMELIVNYPKGKKKLRYVLSFTSVGQRFEIVDEKIENEKPDSPQYDRPYFYYHFNSGNPTLNIGTETRTIQWEDVELEKSILSQRRDPDNYPEVTYLAHRYGEIRLYREWSFGRYTTPRMPQKTDLPNRFLESDASNLGLVLNRLSRHPPVKDKILGALQLLYKGIDDYDIQLEGGTVQVFLREGRFNVPATRLSDGTLRFLCLLTILCHPEPPPLVCIEEPELGLHPDVLPTLAELLIEASERCQLIVTTHSDILIDALSGQPESVIVAEKDEHGTVLRRLDAKKLKPWLEQYRLGQLWTRGDIGGTRW